MAIRVIDDSKLQDIAVAIQGKDGGGQMTVDQMPGRIEAIPSGAPVVSNPALVLWDWKGTKLGEYSAEDALELTELPTPSTLPAYANVDHELLLFQSWNWSLANIKTWIQNHEGGCLDVGAIYTTTDGQDHNYWGNPRLEGTSTVISMQKRATTSIGSGAFQQCYSLTSINIPQGVTSIGNNAFQYCYSLTSINIPQGVTNIGNNAFQYCRSLTSINIPQGVTSIGNNAFQQCYSLTSINIPQGVTNIGDYAFENCNSLTSINIPQGVTSIGNNAFSGCVSVTQINIPDSVTSIRSGAFQYCRSLTQINIPNGVTSIGGSAFYNCNSLCDILLESKPTLANTDAFSSLPTNYRIYVPRSDLSWFETETNWSTIYAQGKIVAAADYLDHLISIGIDVTDFENEVIA